MISRNVLSKGQIVIPKAIRDMLGINVGDEINIDVKEGKIIISKKRDPIGVFYETSAKGSPVSVKEIKEMLEERYEEV